MESAVKDVIDIGFKSERKGVAWDKIQNICFYAAAAFLIGRAAAFGYLFPFATAFSVAAIGKNPKYFYVSIFACLGVCSNMLSKYSAAEICFVIGVNAVLAAVIGVRYQPTHIGLGLLAGAVTGFLKYIQCAGLGAVFLYDVFMILAEVFLVAAFVYIFSKFMIVIKDSDAAEHSMETRASVIVSIAVAFAGLGGLSFYGMNIGYTGILVVVLIASHRGGIGSGGIAGILGGTIMTMVSFSNPAMIGILGFSGVAAGFFKGQWRLYGVICFSIINIFLGAFKEFGIMQSTYVEVIAACAIFLLIPMSFLMKTGFVFSPMQYAAAQTEKKFLIGMEKKLWEYESAFRSLADIYTRSAERKNEPQVNYKSEVFDKVKKEICEKCPLKVDCLEIYDGRTEKYLQEILKGEEGADKRNGFECKEKLAVSLYVKNLLDYFWLDHKWRIKIESSRELMAAQFKGMAGSLEKVMDNIFEGEYEGEKAFEHIEIGISKYAKDGIVCGDSCLGTRLNEYEYLIALSDGMGSGSKAAGESLLTITTLLHFLKAGFKEELALAAINSILILKSTEEIFATVDMGILNAKTGKLKLYKMGAAAAYIKTEDAIDIIKYASLPIGMIGKIRVDCIERSVKPGDMILMVSDGITDADAKDEEAQWMKQSLGTIKTKDPQTMADLIMSDALKKYEDKEKDDMTVLTIHIK